MMQLHPLIVILVLAPRSCRAWLPSTRRLMGHHGRTAVSQPMSALSTPSSVPPTDNSSSSDYLHANGDDDAHAINDERQHIPSSAVNGAAADPSSSSHTDQVAHGKILEGGKIMDFGGVKASDKAETALRRARQQLLEQSVVAPTYTHGTMLGICEDVVNGVGHSLGTFCSPAMVQKVAAYLRSRAPPGLLLLEPNKPSDATLSFTGAQQAQYKRILEQAYSEAGQVTNAFAKTFYMGTRLMDPAARRAIWAVYVWCRRTDEIVDAPRENDNDMLLELASWEMRLENLFRRGQVVDVYDLCLLDVRIQYPTLDMTPFADMIRGMLMDVPAWGQDRYETFDELHLYCYRVAGTVGLMSLPVFGCAPGFDDNVAREPALSLGVAFQLTNILRDVGEDAVQRGRVYLPQEDLRTFGVTEDQLFAQHVDDNYVRLMQFQIARARGYYERARRGVYMLAPESRLPVQSSLDAYGRILDKIEENGYDSLTRRAYVDIWEKLSILPSSWYRSLEISRMFPLPGDVPVVLEKAYF